ncbi:MAG: ATP-binding protein [Xanthomonadales bacterium]|nr:ATP-binding protein [Xanthomonadales bacterium]
MNNFPAVVVLGARQVGKSTLLRSLLPDATSFDLERRSDFQRVSDDPELIFREADDPYVFDEAQLAPSLFNALRVEIDRDRGRKGRFLLSGSSSPQLLNHVTETLAGRCAIVELGTFSWNEGLDKPASAFYTSLSSLEQLKALPSLNDYAELLGQCLSGGYPEPFLNRGNELFFDQWMESYIQSYIERDIRRLFPTLNLDAYQRFIKMLCFASGDIINLSNFSRSLGVSQPTVKKYIEIMEGTFMWRTLRSYEKSLRKSVVKMSKGHIRDTGLICHLLNIHSVDDLKSHPRYGQIWEGFVIEQILKGLQDHLITHRCHYYRTRSKAEIDLILEGRFGTIPIEIKASYSTSKNQIRTLEDFVVSNQCPFGVLINNGDNIYMLSKNVIQIPANYL